MKEAPRLSAALRSKLGVRPVGVDTLIIARNEQIKKLPSASDGKASGVLDWDTFAGPYCRSSEAHVRAVKHTFSKFLSEVGDISGNDGGGGATAVGASALLAYVHCATSLAVRGDDSSRNDAAEKKAASGLAVEMHNAVTVAQFRKLVELVKPLEEWRRTRNVTPKIDASYLRAGSSGAGSQHVPGFHFNPLDSVADVHSGAASMFSMEYGPLSTLLPASAREPSWSTAQSVLDLVAMDLQQQEDQHAAALASRSRAEGGVVGAYDAVWLYAQCGQYAALTGTEIAPESVGSSVLEILRKHARDERLMESSLFDLLGDKGFDLCLSIMEHRRELSAISPNDFKQVAAALAARESGRLDSGLGTRARQRPVMGAGVTVAHASDKVIAKEREKQAKKLQKANKALASIGLDVAGSDFLGDGGGSEAAARMDVLEAIGFNADYLAMQRSLGLQGGQAPPIYGNVALQPKGSGAAGGGSAGDGRLNPEDVIAAVGAGYGGPPKRALPEGTTEIKKEGWMEVSVPASKPAAGGDQSRLVQVADMDPLAQKAFVGIQRLNRLQSELFEAAYRSNENLLVCAPTGAGKTNVAMLTVCRELAQHASPDGRSIRKSDEFKIIYVAPMKALAQEVVAKFGERLSGLGLSVRELTGDMQLTKKEIADTHVIVTTPEKWDVITRKSGDGSLVSLVRLLIIDEVHLLADDRGAVIESIVARTLRLVETSQSIIRIVGLSATLPNYRDVALFLRVNPSRGLFYFDNSYRPVPLQQTFIGVTEKNAMKRANFMDKIAWEKAISAVRRGKQVMVFVHSRKDTGKTARALRDFAQTEGASRLLSPFGDEEAETEDLDASMLLKGPSSFYDGAAGDAKTATDRLIFDGSTPFGVVEKGSASSSSTAAAKGPPLTKAGPTAIQGEGRMNLTQNAWVQMQKDVEKSRNAELRELFPAGFGIHHAGMLRSDRLLTERMFAAGVIKVLCCTATLAWGVNLPAHTVIIKGTQVYDAEIGNFNDLGFLDVMQIFGRAGRPQFDTSGEGIIITGHEKLAHYLSLLTAQIPIESSFIKSLPDHLNAEIVSGTVTNIREAVVWLSYTYLYVRMLKNGIQYGITLEEKARDPLLEAKRLQLITDAAKRLDECHMIRFDANSGNFAVTDLGRVASHFYVVSESVDTFNRMMDKAGIGSGGGGAVTDEDVLNLVCSAHEFSQIKVRNEEEGEIEWLRGAARIKIKGDVFTSIGKTNVLLQAYISNTHLKSFTLISDTAYITQSAGRIARALFEICLRKGWTTLATHLLQLNIAIDKRIWWTASPLRQFYQWNLQPEILKKLEESKHTVEELADMDMHELGALVKHPKLGPRLKALIQQVPRLDIDYQVQPITRNILRLTVTAWPNFGWSERIHGAAEPFWMWVEDANSEHIYHSEYLLLQKRQAVAGDPVKLVFTIPIFEPLPTQYWLTVASDRWMGVGGHFPIDFRHLILPAKHPQHTDLLDLLPLPVAALHNPTFEALYSKSFSHFNPVQTQMFFTVYNTDNNVLLGAPTGSGKTIAAELAVFRLFNAHPGQKAVYVAPLKALVSERIRDWQKNFGERMGKKVVELTGDVTPDRRALEEADIIITTPEKFDGITRSWQQRNYVQKVGVVIIDEIHLLGEDRGPVLEVIVSRMRYIAARTGQNVRFIGLSTALANAHDLGDWLGIQSVGLYNFRPSVRPIPMEVHVQGFPGKHYCPRMASMNKPCFAAITTYSPTKPVLVFVASRRQTRLTALELIALCATAENPKRFLRMEDDEAESYIERVKDQSLRHTLAFGIGIHHAGLSEGDRAIVEELFCAVKIQILVCTSTLAWGVNFPAHLVIVKGTEYFDAKLSRYVDFPVTDVLQMMGRAGRPQFDTQGVAVIMVHEPKKNFYRKFLYEPFPVESQLRHQLEEHINAEISGGSVTSRHDAVEYLTWTYFFRRLLQNPAYYDLDDATPQGVRDYLYQIVDQTFETLEESGCVVLGEDAVEYHVNKQQRKLYDEASGTLHSTTAAAAPSASKPLPSAEDAVAPTRMGQITSYYYLHHTSAAMFSDGLPSCGSSVVELCRLLCNAPELSELPVRHNEDELNERMAQSLPWGVNGQSFSSPHVKAFLLLQARFLHAPLPITDYINDTKSVLDQALRVANAMIDVAADAALGDAVSGMAHLVQSIVQARMPDAHPLLQLPHMTDRQVDALQHALGPRLELKALASQRMDDVRRVLTSNGFSALQATDLLRVLTSLPFPTLNCAWSRRAGASNTSAAASSGTINIRADEEVSLSVQVSMPAGSGKRAYAPRYNRAKEYGWWISLSTVPASGSAAASELLAMKRVGSITPGRTTTFNLEVFAPAFIPLSEGVHKVDVSCHLMSDCIAGLDVEVPLQMAVVNFKSGH